LPTECRTHRRESAHDYNEGTALYHVLVQRDAGQMFQPEGEVWAPNPDLALHYAKEQFTRRGRCHSLWVAPDAAITRDTAEWTEAYRRDSAKRWRHASFFSEGREETPDLVRRLIREEEGTSSSD
jgi:ring-1,2-phenylacetyl-CoA epoxidase subunit PaaB